MSKKVTEIVEEMAAPILEELNLELVEVEYVKRAETGSLEYTSIRKTVWTLKNAELFLKN